MYKLQKTVKTVDDFAQKHRPVFNKKEISLWDLDNPMAYGRDGGTNFKDTQYYESYLAIHRYAHEWINTDNWVADLILTFKFHDTFLNGKENFEDSFNTKKLVDLVEDLFKMYIDNILSLLGNEIRTVKLKNKFWSEKEDYIFTIGQVNEKLESSTGQDSEYTVVQSSLYRNGKKELCYYKDGDKTVGKLPLKYEVVDKQVLIDKIRKDFIKVANRFLSQNYSTSLKVPEISEILKMSREQLLLIQDVYKNKTEWKDVIEK